MVVFDLGVWNRGAQWSGPSWFPCPVRSLTVVPDMYLGGNCS